MTPAVTGSLSLLIISSCGGLGGRAGLSKMTERRRLYASHALPEPPHRLPKLLLSAPILCPEPEVIIGLPHLLSQPQTQDALQAGVGGKRF